MCWWCDDWLVFICLIVIWCLIVRKLLICCIGCVFVLILVLICCCGLFWLFVVCIWIG